MTPGTNRLYGWCFSNFQGIGISHRLHFAKILKKIKHSMPPVFLNGAGITMDTTSEELKKSHMGTHPQRTAQQKQWGWVLNTQGLV